MRDFMKICFILQCWMFIGMVSALNSEQKKLPNVIWIMADDLGYGEVETFPCVPPNQRRRLETPNLNKYFAEEGTQFRHAYAGYTVCAPSRTTLMTGRHSGHFVNMSYSGTSLSPNQAKTIAEIMKDAGYETGAFGKLAPLTDPENQGFDTFIGQVDQSACHQMYPHALDSGKRPSSDHVDDSAGWYNMNLTGNIKNVPSRDACMNDTSAFNYTVDVFLESSLSWLQSRKLDSPFFM
jgi:arylsulfatase A